MNMRRQGCILVLMLAMELLVLDESIKGQAFTTLHNFTAATPNSLSVYTNNDGIEPVAGLFLSGNTLYGTASQGGDNGNGTVFKLNTDGTSFTNLHTFTATSGSAGGLGTNNDGVDPQAGLILLGNALYGTAANGGSAGAGTVFTINTDGMDFTNLHNFLGTTNDGIGPQAGLILSDNILYGTTYGGGNAGSGTVFTINTDGMGYTNLYNFTTTTGSLSSNADGTHPIVGLILSGGTLYGSAWQGGSAGEGTVFRLNTDGMAFTNLHNFAVLSDPPYFGTNYDGAAPRSRLLLSGNNLYGTTYSGGTNGNGTIFKVSTDGSTFLVLHTFTAGANNSSGSFTNGDGAFPDNAGLILSGNALYGVANGGGANGSGAVFKINTNGTEFTTLYSFTSLSGSSSTNSDGAWPYGELVLSGNTLYGVAGGGGSAGNGTVFSLSLTGSMPRLIIFRSGTNVVLTWPTNAPGFTLQSATNLNFPAAWTNISTVPVLVNGRNSVTNPIFDRQQFYRLSQ